MSRRLVQSFIRLDVQDDESLPARLGVLGIDPEKVKGIVLTHQHVDHTGLVPYFPNADIWTSRAEDAAAQSIGAMHPLWRSKTTRTRYADLESAPIAVGMQSSVFLTGDRRFEVVLTPGHTPGSLSVRLAIDGGNIWLIGDTSFRVSDLGPDSPTAGIHSDVRAVCEHHRWRSAEVPGVVPKTTAPFQTSNLES